MINITKVTGNFNQGYNEPEELQSIELTINTSNIMPTNPATTSALGPNGSGGGDSFVQNDPIIDFTTGQVIEPGNPVYFGPPSSDPNLPPPVGDGPAPILNENGKDYINPVGPGGTNPNSDSKNMLPPTTIPDTTTTAGLTGLQKLLLIGGGLWVLFSIFGDKKKHASEPEE